MLTVLFIIIFIVVHLRNEYTVGACEQVTGRDEMVGAIRRTASYGRLSTFTQSTTRLRAVDLGQTGNRPYTWGDTAGTWEVPGMLCGRLGIDATY